ncbi:uncharacterized protein LOC129894908 [Solanum dulcamara]|uniref:uncharacterized protein LOC129894908 n=1 Tax=Solanum dulcamara TaxID=45834 RepID=UPI002486AC95|nr:uncharacterized protein LOC129894908 [Solanum dulcamara]
MRLRDSSVETNTSTASASPSFANRTVAAHDVASSKEASKALQESVRRLYTEPYHSWREIPNSIRQAMFNEFKTLCTSEPRYNKVIATTFERKASAILSSWLKKARDDRELLSWMLPHIFEELCRYWDTEEFKALFEQEKKARASLKGGSLHTGGAKNVGTNQREMEKELRRTFYRHEVFKKIHVKKETNVSDPDEWVRKGPNEPM